MFKSSRKYWLIIAMVIAVMVVGVEWASATPLDIKNYQFEGSNALELGGRAVPWALGWDVSLGGDGGTFKPKNINYAPFDQPYPDGNVAYVNSGYISQKLTDDTAVPYNLTSGHLYTLTVDVGNRLPTAFPGYSIGLWAGGSQITPDTYSGPTPADGTFDTATWTYLAHSDGGQLEIRLLSNGVQTNFDNVRLTNQVVPEPATLFLLGSGLLGVAWFGKKRFKA